MKIIFSEKLPRILKNKKKLEKILNIKITNRGKEVSIKGKSEEEYLAEKVIDAINFGFPLSVAIMIKTEDYVFEIISIKDYTKRKDLKSIRARIIGRGGKTLKILSQLTDCYFELKDNEIGIIGDPEFIKEGQDSVIAIIRGAKQGNVYGAIKKKKIANRLKE